jgi:hypothetical protein
MFEFLERRTSVLAERASELSSTLSDLNSHIKKYTDRLFEWANRIGLTPGIKAEKVAIINAAAQRIAQEIAELSVDSNFEGAEDTSQDPVLIALEPILNNRLGVPLPADEMRKVKEEARQRIEDRRPPGYMDAKKKGENAEGDYIIWYEILREASRKHVDVLLVTRDQKEDWWRKEKGQSKGPRPELVAELEAHAGTRLYMLSPPSLSTHAPEPLSASVSEESIQDAKRVSSRTFIAWNIRLDASDLMEAALNLASSLTILNRTLSGSPISNLLTQPVGLLVNEDIDQDVNPLLERVWEIVDMLAALPTPGSLTSAEQEVLSDIEKLRIIAIQIWLYIKADAYVKEPADQRDSFSFEPLPAGANAVYVQPIAWDDDGIGQYEFSLSFPSGKTYEVTEVVPRAQS